MNTDKQTISDYTQSSLLKILLSDGTNLFWIFIASSFANLLLLTPMIYMLQIFDRIFIKKYFNSCYYIWNNNFILCNKCLKYLHSFSNCNFNGIED